MTKLRGWLLATVILAGVAGAGILHARSAKGKVDEEQEQTLTIDQVPEAVKATILKEAGDHAITEIERETRNGKVVYEAEWKANGKEVEIRVAPDGTLLGQEEDDEEDEEQEQTLTIDQVPEAVKATILKEAGDHAITEIEKETRNGKVVYEAEWKANGKEVEIRVAPDGTLLGQEEDDD